MRQPEDHLVRARASSETAASFAVSAGAGAGKTRVLVDRICNLLAAGTAPGNIAAITFTEAAAGEARHRVRDVLEQRIARGGGDGLLRARAELGQMMATTLHAFALRLLEDEALEAGWSPGTRIADGDLGVLPTGAAVAAWRRRLIADHPEMAARLSAQSAFNVEKTLAALARFRDLALRCADERELEVDTGPLLASIAALHAAADACLAPDTCKLMGCTAEIRAAIPRDARSWPSGLDFGAFALGKVGRVGRQADWPSGALARMRSATDTVREELERLQASAGFLPHRTILLHAEAHYLEALKAAKRDEAIADYDDILFAAAALLQSSATARRRLHARYRHVLVDEVQDVDPLQAALVGYLTRDPECDAAWDAEPPREGRVFAVGDAKQSIFRFRRADHATWDRVRNLVAKNGEHLVLPTNFRSVPGIVSFVNEVFSGLPGYQPQVAFREASDLDPVVVLRTADGKKGEGDTDAVVRYILELRRTHGRSLDWKDFLVVLPAWSHAEALQSAFTEAGIPSFVAGGATFFQRDEVRLAMAALRALEEPGDAEAVVAVLRGLCGASLVDLARHVKLGGLWRYTLEPPADSPCRDGLRLLRRVRELRSGGTLVPLLDELLDETGATAVWSLRVRGKSIQANLDKLRQLIRELESALGTPGEVVARLDAMAKSIQGEEELPARPFRADAVEITSVFKAKGRERKVVLLPHAFRKKDSVDTVIDRANDTVLHKLGAWVPPDWDDAKAAEEDQIMQERRRWMYVAATRASDQLVLCWNDDRKDNDGSADLMKLDIGCRLPRLTDLDDGSELEVGAATAKLRVASDLLPAPRLQSTFGDLEDTVSAALGGAAASDERSASSFAAARGELVQAARRRGTVWRSAKEIATQRVRRREGPLRAGSGTGAGAEVGTVVHRTLEGIELRADAESVRAAAHAELPVQAQLAGLSEAKLAKARDILDAMLAHPSLAAIRSAPEVWHEAPFAHAAPGRAGQVVNGIIDLCFPTDASRTKWIIADWKTDRPPPGSPTEAVYREQLKIYTEGFLATWLDHPVEVEPVLIGPTEDDGPTWDEAFELAASSLGPLLVELRERDVPPPAVGLELDSGRVIAELAWEDARLAVVEDSAPHVEGWTVLAFTAADAHADLVESIVRALP